MEAVTDRKRPVLGRGLGALIPGGEAARSLFFCPVDQILAASDQPRSAINPVSLRDLCESIRESGVLQPVLVKREGLKYRLIAGERRWRAAKMAGLDTIPAMIKEVEPAEAFALALIENVQREDLTDMEEAFAYRRLIEDFGYTQQTLAEKVGKGRSTIANKLRLLDLPEGVQQQVAEGTLSAGHALAVLSVPAPERAAFAHKLIEQKASVREAEEAARPARTVAAEVRKPEPPKLRAVDAAELERRANVNRQERLLCEALETRVVIADRGGRGKVEIFYEDDATLQEVLDRLLEKRR